MTSLAFQQFKARWRRSLAVFIAVILGVAFFGIALLAGGPFNHNLRAGVGQQLNGADLIVTGVESELSVDELETIQEVPGIEAADFASIAPAEVGASGTSSYLLISDMPIVPKVLENIELHSGTWPSQSGEIALSSDKIKDANLSIGDEVSLYSWLNEETRTFTVVGEFEAPSGLAQGRAHAFLDASDFEQIVSNPYVYGIRVQLTDDTNETAAKDQLQSTLGSGYTVHTFNDFVDKEVAELSGSTVVLQVALGGFAAIAMIASGIVIANSFEISLAQRVREIGLLRSVGATTRQVRRLVIAEALIVGIVASAIGVLLAIGMMAVAGKLLWARDGGSTGLEISAITVVVPFILGVLATLLSAYGLARTAMQVVPLQAIRQSDAPVTSPSTSRKRAIFSTLSFVTGAAVMVFAVVSALNSGAQGGLPLMIGILGGAMTFFSVLMSAQVILPVLSRWLGSLASKLFGVTGELATGNLGRNPKRSASAAAALLMGVTLMTMMTVGASSVRTTVVSEVEARQPIDLGIRIDRENQNAIDLDREIARWESIDGVANLAPIQVDELQLGEHGVQFIVGVDPEQSQAILRSSGMDRLADDTIIVSKDSAWMYGLADGDKIELIGDEASVSLSVHVAETGVSEPVVSRHTMNNLTGEDSVGGVWIRLANDSTVGDVMDQIRTGLPLSVELQVGGGASERESMIQLLDTMLLVVVGLLAASVVIAVVGIGNTLTLSVVERTRESGMLRAMGLKRGQVRQMLALEGVAISLIGAIVGIVLGVAYGFAGATTLFGDTIGISLSVPWTQLALICLIAIGSGLLASVLPARRALRIRPVEALSDIG